MSVSIYSPSVKAEATKYGITDLQAYRKLNALEYIRHNKLNTTKPGQGMAK